MDDMPMTWRFGFERFWRVTTMVLLLSHCDVLAGMQTAPIQPLSPAGQRMKELVEKVEIGDKITVRKIDGTEYHGRLEGVADQTFSIDEVDLKASVTISFNDVAAVHKNYGRKGFQGHRVDPKKSLIVGAVFVGVLLTVVFALLATDKS